MGNAGHKDRLSRHRRLVPRTRSSESSHMHVGRARDLRRARRPARRVLRRTRVAAPPGAALPPEARRSRASRWAARSGSTTRASTSTTTCATPRCPSRARDDQLRQLAGRIFSQRLDRSKPLWELWLVQGIEDDRLRAHLEDPPRARRRHRRASTSRRCCSTSSPCRPRSSRPTSPGRPQPEPSDAELMAEGVKGLVRTPCRLAGRALGALQHPGRSIAQAARGRRGHRRGRLGRAEPGARRAAQRADRPAPAAALGAEPARPTSRRSRTRSAARSTTWC